MNFARLELRAGMGASFRLRVAADCSLPTPTPVVHQKIGPKPKSAQILKSRERDRKIALKMGPPYKK